MRISELTAALALTLTLTAPALAQDNPSEPFPPAKKLEEDPGNWRPGATDKPPVLSPTPAPSPAPAPPAVPGARPTPTPAAAPKELTEAEKAKRERQITKNYSDAEKILRGTLENSDGDYKTTSTRVGNLRRLIAKYEADKRRDLKRKRDLQLELFHKSNTYQRNVESGKIPPHIQEQRLKEANQKYLSEKKTLEANLKFYETELTRLKASLAEQEAQKRIMEAEKPSLVRPKTPKKSVSQSILSALDKKIRDLSAFKIKGTLDSSRLNSHP